MGVPSWCVYPNSGTQNLSISWLSCPLWPPCPMHLVVERERTNEEDERVSLEPGSDAHRFYSRFIDKSWPFYHT